MCTFHEIQVDRETPEDLLIPSLTIFGVHCSGGQLATLILTEAGWVRLFSPVTDNSPDPLPLFPIMMQFMQGK